MPGLPATGRRFSIRGAAVGQIRDGKIADQTEYMDMTGLLTQLGAVPHPVA